MTSIAKYFVVGGICFLIDFSIFTWLAKIHDYHYLWVNILSFSIATCTNYLLCIFFVFTSGMQFSKPTELTLVFIVSLIALSVNQVLLYVMFEYLGVELLISKTLSVIFTFLLNYFGRSRLVFGPKKLSEKSEERSV